MTQIIVFLLSLLLLVAIFLRRWYLLEKGQMFGKMVLKKGLKLYSRMTKEDHEVTVKDMIPGDQEIDPKKSLKAQNLYKKVELQLKKNNLQEVEKLLIQVLALNPAHKEAHAQLGMLYLKQSQFAKAELMYRDLVAAVPNDPTYLSNLGLALYQQGKLEEAKTFYQNALLLDNTRAGRYFSLAQIFYELNDFDNALINIQNAIALDMKNVDYALTLAHWYAAKGLDIDAKKLTEDILLVYPNNVEAKEILGKI